MSTSPYGLDLWLAPRTLTSANNTLVLEEDIASVWTRREVTLAAGTYLPTFGLYGGEYLGFFYRLQLAINAETTGTFTLASSTPASTPLVGSGVGLSGVAGFRLLFGDAAWTLPPELLGFGPDQDATVTDTAGEIVGPFTVASTWITPRHAVSKLVDIEHEQYRAGAGAGRVQRRWSTTQRRTIQYPRLPAALVRASRAGESAQYATAAGLAFGDVNNAWQGIWDALSDNATVYLIHDVADTVGMDLGAAPNWERVRLSDEQMDSFGSTIELVQAQGEQYRVRAVVDLLESYYPHA